MKIEKNLLQKSDRVLYSLIIEDKEFYYFLKKFVGSLIFEGNKTRAVKMYDEILYLIKKTLKKEPLVVLHSVFLKLVPVFSIAYKRVGNRYQPVPKFASKNVRVVLIID
jgi:ribosomal protein S7